AVAATREQGQIDEIAESVGRGVAQPRDLVGAEIAHQRSFHRAERLDSPPGVVAWHHAIAPGEVERGLQIGWHPVALAGRRRTSSESLGSKGARLAAAPLRERQ